MTNNSQAEVGYITSVYTDEGRVFVDVALPRPGAKKSRVPFLQLAPGMVVTPAETQQVLVQKLADGNVIASFPLTGSALLPDLGEGELAFVFDENTKIHVNRKWDGTTDVSISASGQTNIHAEGDVNITGGNVLIDGIDFDQHTHDVSYSWTDAGGSSTTTSDSPQ